MLNYRQIICELHDIEDFSKLNMSVDYAKRLRELSPALREFEAAFHETYDRVTGQSKRTDISALNAFIGFYLDKLGKSDDNVGGKLDTKITKEVLTLAGEYFRCKVVKVKNFQPVKSFGRNLKKFEETVHTWMNDPKYREKFATEQLESSVWEDINLPQYLVYSDANLRCYHLADPHVAIAAKRGLNITNYFCIMDEDPGRNAFYSYRTGAKVSFYLVQYVRPEIIQKYGESDSFQILGVYEESDSIIMYVNADNKQEDQYSKSTFIRKFPETSPMFKSGKLKFHPLTKHEGYALEDHPDEELIELQNTEDGGDLLKIYVSNPKRKISDNLFKNLHSEKLREIIVRTRAFGNDLSPAIYEIVQKNPRLLKAYNTEKRKFIDYKLKNDKDLTPHEGRLLNDKTKQDPDLLSRCVEKGLIWAVGNGLSHAAEVLLTNGADVNAKDAGGNTALIEASVGGHKDVVELLLANGADVNAKDNNGYTALIWAAYNGHADVAELLLAHGADVNAKGNNGYTALILASRNGHKDVADLLKKHGAK